MRRSSEKAPAEAPTGASMTTEAIPTAHGLPVQLIALRFALPIEVAATVAALALGASHG